MNVADLRQRLGLSQLQFAIALGVDPMTVSRWERGLHEPSDEHRERLEKLDRRETRRSHVN